MQSQRSVHGLDLSAGAGAKVFWFFSSEKNVLPYQGADFTWFLPGQTLKGGHQFIFSRFVEIGMAVIHRRLSSEDFLRGVSGRNFTLGLARRTR
jgi:hypothetical protein